MSMRYRTRIEISRLTLNQTATILARGKDATNLYNIKGECDGKL